MTLSEGLLILREYIERDSYHNSELKYYGVCGYLLDLYHLNKIPLDTLKEIRALIKDNLSPNEIYLFPPYQKHTRIKWLDDKIRLLKF